MLDKLIAALSDYFEVGSNCYHYILERVKWAELKTEDFREYDDDDVAELAEFLVKNCNLSEQKHGHWIIDKSFMPFISTCSECGATYDIDGAFDWKFCPICGARMDGATNYEF
jgi:rubrerythrin